MTQTIEPENLFDDVEEGDQIMIDGREEPLTVYRHVTEDDARGQLITMLEVREEWAKDIRWEAEHTDKAHNGEIEAGDLIEAQNTGDEFLIARGPRGGAYLLTQQWSKYGGRWTAKVSYFRITRDDPRKRWEWENYVSVSVVSHDDDIDRDTFDNGIDAVVSDASGRTIWADSKEGVRSEYNGEVGDAGYDGGEPVNTMFGPMCNECGERRPRKDGKCWTCHPESLPA